MASIFLSHSSQDNAAAADLSARLKERGYESLFLDFDPDSGIKAGRNWEHELYRNLKLAGAVIVLCSPTSMASRWCFVEIAQAKALGKPIFPVTIVPCQVESILNDRQVIDLTAVGPDEAYRRLFDGLRAAGLDPFDAFHWDPRRAPYPGLGSFEAEDAGVYFGREDEIRRLIETLTRLQRQGEPRLLVIVGSSGSGKSSLIRAGVLPRLAKEHTRWVVIDPFRPGAQPISELARSLVSAFPGGTNRPDWRSVRDQLHAEERAAGPNPRHAAATHSLLGDLADDLTMQRDRREASVLVVVDQVEELLQRDKDEGEASRFFNVLRRAVERPGGRVFGLLTLRSDFLGSFQNHPALRGAAFADLPLGLLPLENFPTVIEGPADRAAVTLEPGLVRSMLADARTDDALPLLAFTLREMYERCRDQGRLTLAVYRDELGGIKGAVARVVERIKAESPWLPETDRALRRAFLKLVRVNDEGQFTRQPCRWADLPDSAAPVLEAFVKARLLSTNGDLVEVAHESLFRVWPELVAWLDEGRELMLWRKNIQTEVDDWLAHDRSPLYLLSGARVAEGRRWLAAHPDDFPGPEGEFITASIAAEDARHARERAQQEKLRWLARTLAVATVVASIAGAYALFQRNEANSKARAASEAQAREKAQRERAEAATTQAEGLARIATSRQLAALSVTEMANRDDRALLLAAAAYQEHDTLEARRSLYGAIQNAGAIETYLPLSAARARGVAFSPDGKTIAAGASTGQDGADTVVFWDVATAQRQALSLPVKEGNVQHVRYSPDGVVLAAAFGRRVTPSGRDDSESASGMILWNLATHRRITETPLEIPGRYVEDLAFSPDGTKVSVRYAGAGSSTGHGERGVLVWDTASRRRLADHRASRPENDLWDVALSPDHAMLALACGRVKQGTIVLRSTAAKGISSDTTLPVDDGLVWKLLFTPDGTSIVGGYRQFPRAGIRVWNAATRRPRSVEPLAEFQGVFQGLHLGPDGKVVAAIFDQRSGFGPDDAVLMLWDLGNGKPLVEAPFRLSAGHLDALAFAPTDPRIAAVYDAQDRSGIVIWNPAPPSRLVDSLFVQDRGSLWCMTLSPDGRTWAAGYGLRDAFERGGVVLWDAETRSQVDLPLPVPQATVFALAFSPDGKTLAAGLGMFAEIGERGTGGVMLYDTATRKPRLAQPLPVPEGPVRGVAFSADGKLLIAGQGALVGEGPSSLVTWDTATDQRTTTQPPNIEGAEVACLAISPNGQTLAVGQFAGGAFDGTRSTVTLWPLGRLNETPRAIPVVSDELEGLTFSPDGKLLALACHGSGVVLLDVASGKRIGEPLLVPEGFAQNVAFSADGKLLAAACRLSYQNGGVVLWELASRKRLVDEVIPLQGDSIEAVGFSPDGKSLLAAYGIEREENGKSLNQGGVARLDIDPASWIAIARRIVNRNFTQREWREYDPDRPYQRVFPDLPVADEPPSMRPLDPAALIP